MSAEWKPFSYYPLKCILHLNIKTCVFVFYWVVKILQHPTGSTLKIKLCLELTDLAMHPQIDVVGPAKAKNHVYLKVFPKLYPLKMFYSFSLINQTSVFIHPSLVLQKCLLGKESKMAVLYNI